MKKSILILNGPNLNMLGSREPEVYGEETLADIHRLCDKVASKLDLTVDFRNSNSEGTLVDWIQASEDKHSAILLNAGAYSHTSIAILDALRTINIPVIEVHLSNIFQREDSQFFFMRVFVKYTNPIINLFKFITPSFLFGPFIALYVAWFFYLFRFYAMPYLLGYDVWGMLAFPLESDFSRQLYQIFK